MLIGNDGTSLELRIVGYQFPELEPGQDPLDPDSWDANWLIVEGEARTAEGESWAFSQPALTTWDVARVVSWLREVVDGTASVLASEEQDASFDHPDWLTFTEPNLSFAVRDYGQPHVTLLVQLSHESAAPPISPRKPKRSHLTMMTDKRQLQEGLEELEGQLAKFPSR